MIFDLGPAIFWKINGQTPLWNPEHHPKNVIIICSFGILPTASNLNVVQMRVALFVLFEIKQRQIAAPLWRREEGSIPGALNMHIRLMERVRELLVGECVMGWRHVQVVLLPLQASEYRNVIYI